MSLPEAILIAVAFSLAGPAEANVTWEFSGTLEVFSPLSAFPSLTADDPFSITVTVDETTIDSNPGPAGVYPGAIQSVAFDFGSGAYSFTGAPGTNRVVIDHHPDVLGLVFSPVAPLDGHDLVEAGILLFDNTNDPRLPLTNAAIPTPLPPFDVWGFTPINFSFTGDNRFAGLITSSRQIPESTLLLLLTSAGLVASGLRHQ